MRPATTTNRQHTRDRGTSAALPIENQNLSSLVCPKKINKHKIRSTSIEMNFCCCSSNGTERDSLRQAPVGMSMLEVAHRNDIELEGACEGSLACSTCHVIIQDQVGYSLET